MTTHRSIFRLMACSAQDLEITQGANMIVDGQTRVYLPGGGTVLINTGHAVYAADGSIEFEQGPHPFDAYFGGADPTALEPICASVGAP